MKILFWVAISIMFALTMGFTVMAVSWLSKEVQPLWVGNIISSLLGVVMVASTSAVIVVFLSQQEE